MKKSKSANGVKGILLLNMDGLPLFRVYTHNGKDFIDYEIRHSDLQVIINDVDAYFYNDDVLDHSPETLGKRK